MNHRSAQREVWLAMPSKNPANCAKHLPAWRERGYRIAVLQDGTPFDCDADEILLVDRYEGWPSSVNRLCREVVPSSSDIVVAVGDDMQPDPHHTADQLAEQFFERFPDGFGIMQPHGDRFLETHRICGSPWLGRGWIERAYRGKGPMPPWYFHHGADDELYWVSRCLDRLWSRPDLTQYHDHFLRRGEQPPHYWQASALGHNEDDLLLFIARSRSGFPSAEPLGSNSSVDTTAFANEYDGRVERYYSRITEQRTTKQTTNTPASMVDRALQQLARDGCKRIAIYGAGAHTRNAGPALAQPPVHIAAILDDNAREGQKLWRIPVVLPVFATSLRIDAVILSSDGHENDLWRSSAPLRERGIRVLPLYNTDRSENTATQPALAS